MDATVKKLHEAWLREGSQKIQRPPEKAKPAEWTPARKVGGRS